MPILVKTHICVHSGFLLEMNFVLCFMCLHLPKFYFKELQVYPVLVWQRWGFVTYVHTGRPDTECDTVFHNNIIICCWWLCYNFSHFTNLCTRMFWKLHLMLGVENNLNKSAIPYLNCFGVSLFLEGVKRHLGEFYFPMDCH